MHPIIDKFKELLEERGIPMQENKLNEQQTLFGGSMQVNEETEVPFSVIFASEGENSDYLNFQITYHHIGYVGEGMDRADLFDKFNHWHRNMTGYYRLTVIEEMDNEITLQAMGLVGEDLDVLYAIMITGGRVVQNLVKEINELTE